MFDHSCRPKVQYNTYRRGRKREREEEGKRKGGWKVKGERDTIYMGV